MPSIEHRICPVVDNDDLDELFAASWPAHEPTDLARKHAYSLAFVRPHPPRDGARAGRDVPAQASASFRFSSGSPGAAQRAA